MLRVPARIAIDHNASPMMIEETGCEFLQNSEGFSLQRNVCFRCPIYIFFSTFISDNTTVLGLPPSLQTRVCAESTVAGDVGLHSVWVHWWLLQESNFIEFRDRRVQSKVRVINPKSINVLHVNCHCLAEPAAQSPSQHK